MIVELSKINAEVLISLTEMLNNNLSSVLSIRVFKEVLYKLFKSRQIC